MTPADRTARGLVDMSERPAPTPYEPPPRHVCDIVEFPFLVELDDDLLEVQVVQWIYRDKVVHFALMLSWVAPEGETQEISRIDACHGEVHQHFFDRSGVQVRREVLREIIVDGSEWSVVDSLYDPCLAKITDHAPEYYRRWK